MRVHMRPRMCGHSAAARPIVGSLIAGCHVLAANLFVRVHTVFMHVCAIDHCLFTCSSPQASAPIVDSLFADSIPTGKRAGLYTALTVSYVLSSAVGPATAAALFVLHGNEWSTDVRGRVCVCVCT